MITPTREELIKLCRQGVVPHEKWWDRDSASAQRQLGECRQLLECGCDFRVLVGDSTSDRACISDEDTWWVDIEYRGFMNFEVGGSLEVDTFYVPTKERLDLANGRDWY